MNYLRRAIHFASTAWFILAIFYVLIVALAERGFSWVVIFSVSGYSFILVTVLVSFYLFAIYRNLVSGKADEGEHPFTRTGAYMSFYDISPLLGGLAGLFSSIGFEPSSRVLSMTAIGTFAVTFFVWVILDPILSLCEMMLPRSMALRKKRLSVLKQQKIQDQIYRKNLLDGVAKKQVEFVELCKREFNQDAQHLRELIDNLTGLKSQNYTKIVEYGLKAWKIGGLDAMSHLFNMAVGEHKNKKCLAYLWEGIGNWKAK